MASFVILDFFPLQRLNQIIWQMTFGKTLGWILIPISICMQNVIEMNVQEIGPVLLLSEFGPWQNHDRWQMAFDTLLNMNNFTKFHQKFSHASRTHVTYENMMSHVWTYVKMLFKSNNYVTYDIICPIYCYIRKFVVSKYILLTNMRYVLSELMLHTKL